ncbi:HlyD family efflux transporter periplasmic adaptor subunit [Orrella daihaiensis]|uniref:HlyD family efflux transporter periplasmic adaptor subunit n=1 Tax=Orrella daihaiensis TaxID=2782176 RepID=A0ABY4AMU7_9BURK|nr:HlyD family efflux transporter periplasmic adaptor subunit [Orrella daihaiensis]UOD50395.1 HlyD family efflux transporter periplasmic adaptor subunit [Orrella daihaiensis]
MSKKDKAPVSQEEEDFVFSAIEEDEGRWGRYLVYLVLIVVAAAIAWASYFQLDEVTVANGKVIPASRGQVVQVLETGILKELNVKEGEEVKKGQVLLQLDDSRAGPVYREAYEKWQSLLARATRLRAEAYGMELKFPPEVAEDKELVEIETKAFKARKSALDEQLVALEKSRDALNREVELTAPLVKQGVVSEVELLRLKRQASGLEGQIAELRTRYLTVASDELVRVDAELGQVSEILMAHEQTLARTTVRSPTDGIVKDIGVSTIGAIINSGQVIMEIVPTSDEMLVEAFMPPTEVAYVEVGAQAKVKLSAYDTRRYGDLDGEVILVSPDVLIEDSKGGGRSDATPVNFEPGFYKILVKITNAGIERNGMKLIPRPGMTATVDILTGEKTVMEYIFRPIESLRDALRER